MAPPGHAGAVRRCPLIGVNRKWLAGGQYDAIDPDWVKTCTRGECAELFSLFSPFDGACQSGSFLIQRNRNKRSTRKFDVGVFTQPGPEADGSGAELGSCASREARRPHQASVVYDLPN
jgi:hypothetical protein